MGSLPSPMTKVIDDGPKIIVFTLVLSTVSLLCVIGRIYSRTRNMGLDDWAMILAMLLCIGTVVVNIILARDGAGRNLLLLNHHDRTKVGMTLTVSQPVAPFGACSAKISVALLLQRIIVNCNKFQNMFLWFIIIFVFISNVLLTITEFVQCIPVQRIWDTNVAGTCRNINSSINMANFQGAFTDFTLAMFSVFLLRNIQMKRSIKVGICFLMSLGIIAGIAAVIRVVKQAEFNRNYTSFTPIIYWYTAELNLIIITACIPTMKPLFLDIKRLMRRQHDVPQEIPDSQCDLRHIKKTTDIYAEFTDDHQLQSLPSSATKSNACADHGVMQERQIV